MNFLLLVNTIVSFRTENLFANQYASETEVRSSIKSFNEKNITSMIVLRTELCNSSSDDIVFDAIVGSKVGRVKTTKFFRVLESWNKEHELDLNKFQTSLLKSQLFVLFSQTIYLSFQASFVVLVYKILMDLYKNS